MAVINNFQGENKVCDTFDRQWEMTESGKAENERIITVVYGD